MSPVQCLRQCRAYMKMNLRGWRAQIWKPWFGAKSVPGRTGLQTTASAAVPRRAVSGNLRKSGATSSPVQCLHKCKVDMKRKLRG